eukprot:sb/3476215/
MTFRLPSLIFPITVSQYYSQLKIMPHLPHFLSIIFTSPYSVQISETVIYRTIESKRRSVLDSNDFDGTVSLDQIISSEELDKGYRVLPILLPYISQEYQNITPTALFLEQYHPRGSREI